MQETYSHGAGQDSRRLPAWLRRPIAHSGSVYEVDSVLVELEINTVCKSAKCPNRGECFSAGTATFLIMGDTCTRRCGFCAVESRTPQPLDASEPSRIAEACRKMGLRHVVITSVTRDDLPDGGAAHFVEVVSAVREALPDASVEVLTSDFGGRLESVDAVVSAKPDVFNHNVETVPRLYVTVRPQAEYRRSIEVLARVHDTAPGMPTKSGLMLGLGETEAEVLEVMSDLLGNGVRMLTLGQYLRPSKKHLPVERFVEPSEFAELARQGYRMGFEAVASAPFVRSSYHASSMLDRHGTVGVD